MKYDFAKNVQVAINSLLNYEVDGSIMIRSWKNFVWFREINAEPIEEIGSGISNSSVFKILERKITFYSDTKILLAEIVLRGNELTNSDESKPISWKVTKICYRKDYNEKQLYDEYRWVETEVVF